MALNLKKGQIITILDVLLIAFVMFFAKSYLNKYNKNSTSVTKDGVKYTLVINNQKIVKDELMNIRFKIENKKKDKKILEIKKAVPFNYIIEKDGKFIFISKPKPSASEAEAAAKAAEAKRKQQEAVHECIAANFS